MANQDIIGTTNCSCCGARVNLKRNKNGKAYYFCHGELELRMCKNPQGGMNADLSRRIISISAKNGGKPHFTKIKMTAENEPIVEIEEKIEEQKEEIKNEENSKPEPQPATRNAVGNSQSKSEWPYV